MSEIRNHGDGPFGKLLARILEGIFPGDFRTENHSLWVPFLMGKTDGVFDWPGSRGSHEEFTRPVDLTPLYL